MNHNRSQRPTVRLECEALEDRVTPATLTWTGAVDGLWSHAGNWSTTDVSHPVPQNGDAVVLPAGAANRDQGDDLGAHTFASITMQDVGYRIAGDRISITGGITAKGTSLGVDTILNDVHFLGQPGEPVQPIVLGDGVNLSVFDLTADLTADGPANLSVQGPNTAELTILDRLTVTADSKLDIQTNLNVLGALVIQPGNPALPNGSMLVESAGLLSVEPGASFSTGGDAVFTGGTLTVHGTVYVNLGGTLEAGQGAFFNIQIDGSIYVVGTLIDSNARIDDAGLIVIENNYNGPEFLIEGSNAVLNIGGGGVGPRGTLYSAGLTESIGGQIYNYSTILVASGGANGQGLYLYDSVLGNAGAIYAYGTVAIEPDSALYDYGTLVLESSGYLYDADLFVVENEGVFYDYGTFFIAPGGTYYNFGQQIGG